MVLAWWVWVILGGLLALAELHAPGSYLIWIALGAVLTSAVHAAFGASLEGQLATFALTSVLSCLAGYFVYRRLGRRRRGETPLNDRAMAMLGARGTVCEGFLAGRGKIRLGDSVWLATGPDLAEGTPVVVNGVRGTTLIVAAVSQRAAGSSSGAASGP